METVLKGDAGGALTAARRAQPRRRRARPGDRRSRRCRACRHPGQGRRRGQRRSRRERGRARPRRRSRRSACRCRRWRAPGRCCSRAMRRCGAARARSAAADMVLVRLAYAADLPPPGELARRLAGWRRHQRRPSDGRAVAQTIAQARARPRRGASRRDASGRDARARPVRETETSAIVEADDEPPEPPAPLPELNSFEDVWHWPRQSAISSSSTRCSSRCGSCASSRARSRSIRCRRRRASSARS